MELCPALGSGVPVGKDSLSMRTRWQGDGGEAKQVTAPVSLVVTAFASIDDVRRHSTPELQPGDTTLLLIDLGSGRMRMGGSILAQTTGQFGDAVPDLDDPQTLRALADALARLRDAGLMLAYHDRSDGGLWAAACEMAFAGHIGVSLNVDLLVTESDGIADSRAEYGDSKNWAAQVSARREELTLRALFNEELGAIVQVSTARRDEAIALLRAAGLGRHSHVIGKTNTRSLVEVWRDAKTVFGATLLDLQQAWDEVSWRICRLRDNPACADAEHAVAGRGDDPGLHVHLAGPAFSAEAGQRAAPAISAARPRSRWCASRASTATSS
jgi:phosphoribosylformylglycinamidine synthase